MQEGTKELMQAFAVGAHLNLLKHWVNNGFQETPIQLAHIASELLLNGFGSILKAVRDEDGSKQTGT